MLFLFRNNRDRTVFGIREWKDLVQHDLRKMATRVVQDIAYRRSLISDDPELPRRGNVISGQINPSGFFLDRASRSRVFSLRRSEISFQNSSLTPSCRLFLVESLDSHHPWQWASAAHDDAVRLSFGDAGVQVRVLDVDGLHSNFSIFSIYHPLGGVAATTILGRNFLAPLTIARRA